MLPWSLSSKRVLVTGGTKGIGRAVVEEMLGLGAEVLFVARNAGEVNDFASELRARDLPATGLDADVATAAGRAAVLHAVEARWGALDVLVNNVGTNIRKTLVDIPPDEFQHIVQTNLHSTVEMCRLFFPLLQAGKNAAVINIASVAGMVDVGSGATYAMTKAAEIQLTRSLACEWAPHGIRVNTVSPWYIRTPLTEAVLNQPERLRTILSRTPQGRVGEPAEVAAAVAFLAMDRASFITGQNLAVDGGFLAKGM